MEVNAPLPFALKQLDHDHPSIGALGISPATVAHFGLGYCSRGFLKGRIAIPLHDQRGRLAGYAGRLPTTESPSSGEPRYRFPGDREREGTLHHFAPEQLVYGAHLVSSPPRAKLIVAEEFSLVWHLWELGIEAVALPTGHMSPVQSTILNGLVMPGGLVFVGRSVYDPRLAE